MKPLKYFDDFIEAFAYCREKDQPVTVQIRYEIHKLMPSGSSQFVRRVMTTDQEDILVKFTKSEAEGIVEWLEDNGHDPRFEHRDAAHPIMGDCMWCRIVTKFRGAIA